MAMYTCRTSETGAKSGNQCKIWPWAYSKVRRQVYKCQNMTFQKLAYDCKCLWILYNCLWTFYVDIKTRNSHKQVELTCYCISSVLILGIQTLHVRILQISHFFLTNFVLEWRKIQTWVPWNYYTYYWEDLPVKFRAKPAQRGERCAPSLKYNQIQQNALN
jgi:hypothetical protein